MLTREHIPENVKRNDEEINYTTAIGAIDLSGVSDPPTKAALENILVMVKALKETKRQVV